MFFPLSLDVELEPDCYLTAISLFIASISLSLSLSLTLWYNYVCTFCYYLTCVYFFCVSFFGFLTFMSWLVYYYDYNIFFGGGNPISGLIAPSQLFWKNKKRKKRGVCQVILGASNSWECLIRFGCACISFYLSRNS